MVRGKVRYELLADERTRRDTFKKRKSGLFKKLDELTKLCEVEACGVVINGDGAESEAWPSVPDAYRIVERFNKLPYFSQANVIDQAGFLRQNLSRISKNLEKETIRVQSLENELLLVECVAKEEVNCSESSELHDILYLLEKKIRMVGQRIATIESSSSSKVPSAEEKNDELYHGKGKQPF